MPIRFLAFFKKLYRQTLMPILPLIAVSLCASLGAQNGSSPGQWTKTIEPTAIRAMSVGPNSQIYLAGNTTGRLPVTPNAFQPEIASMYYNSGFVYVLNESGTKVVYCSYLNGLIATSIAVDHDGYIYVFGYHPEPDVMGDVVSFPFPVPVGAAQPYPGVTSSTPLLVKLAPSGELIYATYVGGRSATAGAVAADSDGRALVCGTTGDPYLPVSDGAFQPNYHGNGDLYIARVSGNGARFENLTYLGGGGEDDCADLKLDADGNVYVFGTTDSRFFPVTPGAYQPGLHGYQNLFVAKLDSALKQLFWSTYLGGSKWDEAASLAITPRGSLFLTGETAAEDFPSTAGTSPPYLYLRTYRPFIAVLDATGSQLLSANVLPFPGEVLATSATADRLYASLYTQDSGTTVCLANSTLNATPRTIPRDQGFACLMRFNGDSSVPDYLGPIPEVSRWGSVPVSALPSGNVVLAGVAPPAGSGVSVVSSRQLPEDPHPSIIQVLNPASLRLSAISPGQVVEVRGTGLGSASTSRVLFDGQLAPLISIADSELLTVAPSAFVNPGKTQIVVERDSVASVSREIDTTAANPALFTAPGTGSGQALAFNEDASPNSPQRPAKKGKNILDSPA